MEVPMKNLMTLMIAILFCIALSVQFIGCGTADDVNNFGDVGLEEGLGTPEEGVELTDEGFDPTEGGDDVKELGTCPQDIICPSNSGLGGLIFTSRIAGGIKCWYQNGQIIVSAPGCPYCCVKWSYPPNCSYTYFLQPWTCGPNPY